MADGSSSRNTVSRGFQWWILTIPQHEFVPYLPPEVGYSKGQLEEGEGGFLHWQFVVWFSKKQRLSAVRRIYGSFHAEPTRSDAAREYVWKEETAIDGTRFELGVTPFRQNCKIDWDIVKKNAIDGKLDEIPSRIFVAYYSGLKRIQKDHLKPVGMERKVWCFWGRTGTGKSRRAWDEAGWDAYPKDPNTKFWDGYSSQANVVIDEFRGLISISSMLRWLDRYPVTIETKGSAMVLSATSIWVTSNVDPRCWYPCLDQETISALCRRMEIIEFE